MSKKRPGTLLAWFFAGVAIFLVLPFATNEGLPLDKKANLSEGALPLEGSQNPISKYFERLAEFYNLKEKKSKDVSGLRPKFLAKHKEVYSSEEEISDPQLEEALSSLFSASSEEVQTILESSGLTTDQISSIRNTYEKNAEAAAKGVAYTKSGLEIKPTKDGYYYKGMFLKNGTYPEEKYRGEIETALSRYHKWQAAQQGLVPAYIRNSNGDLTVSYLAKKDFNEAERAQGQYRYWGSNADRYAGARVISKDSSAPYSRADRGKKKVSKRYSGDMASLYASISDRLKFHAGTSSAENVGDDSSQENGGGGSSYSGLSKELMDNSDTVSPMLMSSTGKIGVDSYNPEYEKMKKVFVNSGRGRGADLGFFLKRYGIELDSMLHSIRIPPPNKNANQEYYKPFINNMRNHKGSDEEMLAFSALPIYEGSKAHEVFLEMEKEGYKIIYPYTPYVDVDKNGQPVEAAFSIVFLNRRGLQNMFRYMGAKYENVSKLEAEFRELDKRRRKNNENFERISNNEKVRERMPKVVFYLGKGSERNGGEDSGKVMIASSSSFLYAYSPQMAPEFVAKGDNSSAVQKMTPENFINTLNASSGNNIVVANDKAVGATLKKAGAKNVVVINEETLYSGVPQDIGKVIDILSDEIDKQIRADAELKDIFEKKEEVINDIKNAERIEREREE